MKYLMQILLGLILLQLLQSCDYSKSRDVLWMKKNFENNAELFFDVTNLFNNSIPINLKKENYVNFNINDKNNSVDIIIISKKVINGERVTQKANSQRLDNKNFNLLLYLQPIITQYFIDNKSEIWLLFLIAHSKR